MSYDPRCYELAEIFLDDQPSQYRFESYKQSLAECIQAAIEAWLEELELPK
jgi:hypothetical protein